MTLTIPLEELREVSLAEVCRLTHRVRDYWKKHWLEMPGAEISEGGYHSAPIHGLKQYQQTRGAAA